MIWLHRIVYAFKGLRLRLRFLFRKGAAEQDLDEELRFHLEQEVRRNARAGMEPAEARRQANISFGGVDRFKEQVREAQGVRPLQDLAQDVRYGMRQMGKNPSFTLIAILTLTLGIGANTAIFTLVNGLILNPLPFDGGDRLVEMWRTGEQFGRSVSLTPTREMMAAWKEEAESFNGWAGFDETEFLLTSDAGPSAIEGAHVSPQLLNWFGAVPVVGRTFSPDEARPGADRVVVLSESLWRSRFGADPHLVGRTIHLGQEAHEVVGILPDRISTLLETAFSSTGSKEIWVPLAEEADGSWVDEPYVIGRLRPGVTYEAADAELKVIQAHLEYGGVDSFEWEPSLVPADQALSRELRTGLWVLLGAVGLVLLIACVNTANLLLSRQIRREQELAVRLSLGAGLRRIARQLLTENLILSVVGAGLGLLLAHWILDGVAGIPSTSIPELRNARIEPLVFFFTAGLVIPTALLFGIAPVLRLRRLAPVDLLGGGARGGTASRRRIGIGNLLVGVEVALAMVLVLGAGLLMNSLKRLREVDPGIDTTNLMAIHLDFPEDRYPDNPARWAFWENLVDRVEGIGQVRAVTWSRSVPPQIPAGFGTTWVEGREAEDPGTDPVKVANWVSADYFEVVGLRIREGRGFSDQDMAEPSTPIMINQALADSYWPDGGAVGSRIQLRSPFSPETPSPWLDVIGVVDDVKAWSLGDRPDRGQFYMPATQVNFTEGVLLVRTEEDPLDLLPLIQEQIWAMDPLLPVRESYRVGDRLIGTVVQERFNTILLSSFAVLGLFLAIIGVWGVVSLAVGQRARELGIRIALGAGRQGIVGTVMGRTMTAVFGGLVLGSVGSLGLSRFIEGLLFEVTPNHLGTYLASMGVLAAAGGVASLLPSLRALSADPRQALKEE